MSATHATVAGLPTSIRPQHLPDLAVFVPLLRDAAGHLHELALSLAADPDTARKQLLTLAAQAAGIERLARQALDAMARRAA